MRFGTRMGPMMTWVKKERIRGPIVKGDFSGELDF